MIDFKNNTYTVTQAEKAEVIKILKRHPEYRGFSCSNDMYLNKCDFEKYKLLWQVLENWLDRFDITAYLGNEFLTAKMIDKNSDMIRLTEVFGNPRYAKHTPQPLLPYLRQIDKQLIRMD